MNVLAFFPLVLQVFLSRSRGLAMWHKTLSIAEIYIGGFTEWRVGGNAVGQVSCWHKNDAPFILKLVVVTAQTVSDIFWR